MGDKKRSGKERKWRKLPVAGLVLASVFLMGAAGGGSDGTERKTITYESPVFTGDGEAFRPKELLEQGGITYRLVSTNIRRAKKEGELTYLSSEFSCELEGNDAPPETAVITVWDETLEAEYHREVPLLEAKEQEIVWQEDFTFPITVSSYGADSFMLGEYEIPGDAELSEYGSELLAFLNLPEEAYRIDRVVWTGEPYEKDGVNCRDAKAYGARRIRYVLARYGGQVRTPDVEGKQYIGIYEAEAGPEETKAPTESETDETPKETEAVLELPKETLPPEPEKSPPGMLERIFQWLWGRRTVITIGGLFFLAIFAAAVAVRLSFRQKKKQD